MNSSQAFIHTRAIGPEFSCPSAPRNLSSFWSPLLPPLRRKISFGFAS
jgi:hypothetical protein